MRTHIEHELPCMSSGNAFDARACVRMNDRIALKKSNTSRVPITENSCTPISLRVQSGHCKRRSMRWSNKQPSTSELNSDSFGSSHIVNGKRRKTYETSQSCGFAPALEIETQTHRASLSDSFGFRTNAGLRAGVFVFRHWPRASFFGARPHRVADSRMARASMRTAFISVSGFRADRSALRSDLRLKRTSGLVAATGHPYAPMNSSRTRSLSEPRVSFSTFRLTS